MTLELGIALGLGWLLLAIVGGIFIGRALRRLDETGEGGVHIRRGQGLRPAGSVSRSAAKVPARGPRMAAGVEELALAVPRTAELEGMDAELAEAAGAARAELRAEQIAKLEDELDRTRSEWQRQTAEWALLDVSRGRKLRAMAPVLELWRRAREGDAGPGALGGKLEELLDEALRIWDEEGRDR